MPPTRRNALLRVLVLVGVAALIVLLFIYREQVQSLQRYGYLGIFLISIAANATIIIPLPGVAITTAMGAIFHPLGVAIAAGLGAALGELSGYLAGVSGQGIVEKTAFYEKLTDWMRAHPRLNMLVLFVLAFIPNPLFDVAGLAAGTLKIPLWQFLLPCAAGKILKMALFAYAGAFSFGWVVK